MQQIILDDWQQEALDHEGNLLLCTGRQIGKTMTLAIKCGNRMLDIPGTRIIIASLTEDQAKLIIVMILSYLEQVDKKAIGKGRNKPTQNKVVLKNGSFAIARPVGNTGDALRGFTGEVLVLDEVSRFSEAIMTAAKPTLLSTAGQIWAASTPFGKKGWFYNAYLNKANRFKVIHKSSEEAIHERKISESWTEEKRREIIKFLDEEKTEMSALQYGQEYQALFLEDLQQYFPDELIDRCCILDRPSPPGRGKEYFMGVDIARMGNDEITYEILQKINAENILHVESIVKKKQLTTQTEQDIVDLSKTWNEIEKIGLDAGAGTLGVSVFDHLLQVDETKRKIVAINNRARPLDRDSKKKQRLLKEDLYDNLRSLMEKGHIRLLNDAEVRLSLKSVQWKLPDENDGNIKIFGNYTHIVEGVIRAAILAKDKGLNIWVRSIKA